LQAFSVVEGCMGGMTESMVSEEVAAFSVGGAQGCIINSGSTMPQQNPWC
jgi:hypothetical protein